MDKPAFILDAINQYKGSAVYKKALSALSYSNGENEGIAKRMPFIEKIGMKGMDYHRIGNSLYPKMKRHLVFYALGNGPNLPPEREKLLGRDFAFRFLIEGVMPACDAGVCYALWSVDPAGKGRDKLVYITALQGFPLLDERTNNIRAFVRFWQIADKKPLCVQLYEADGVTEYQRDANGRELKEFLPKRAYKTKVANYEGIGETEIVDIDNYPEIPIFPLYVNESTQSELTANLKAILDAYDYIASDRVGKPPFSGAKIELGY